MGLVTSLIIFWLGIAFVYCYKTIVFVGFASAVVVVTVFVVVVTFCYCFGVSDVAVV